MSKQETLFGEEQSEDEVDTEYLRTKKMAGGVPDVWKLASTITANRDLWWSSTCSFCGDPAIVYCGETGKYGCEEHKASALVQPGHDGP